MHKKSFDKIVQNIGIALKNDTRIALRVNTDANNIESIAELKEVFQKQDYFKHPKFHMYSAMVVVDENLTDIHRYQSPEWNTDEDWNWKQGIIDGNDGSKLLSRKAHVTGLRSLDLGIDYQFSDLRDEILKLLHEKKRFTPKVTSCGVSVSFYAFDPVGNVYSCWDMIGTQEDVWGTYGTGTVQLKPEVVSKWHDRHVGTITKCSACKYAFLCGGGCPAKAARAGQGIGGSYCNEYPNMFQLFAKDAYKLYKAGITKTTEMENREASETSNH